MVDVADFERELHVNVTGTFVTIKAAAPHLARAGGGAIVAVSSIAAILTHPLMAAYSTSKAALDMLVRNAADELGRFGVRVNRSEEHTSELQSLMRHSYAVFCLTKKTK